MECSNDEVKIEEAESEEMYTPLIQQLEAESNREISESTTAIAEISSVTKDD